MTLKTFACDSIAEKIRFVNEFFLSLEMRKLGKILWYIFKIFKVGVYLACPPYGDICLEFPFSFQPQ